MLKSLQSLIRAVLAINIPCVTLPRWYNYSEGSGDRLELYIYILLCTIKFVTANTISGRVNNDGTTRGKA
jgi:hypothetical protein